MLIPDECLGWISFQRPQVGYATSVYADYEQIAPHLPEKVETILDIGCGMAGIDVLLMRKYPYARLELLDGDGKFERYGFSENPKPYSSRSAAEKLLKTNGFKCHRWHDVGTKELLKADLVVSLLSWGFHYPLKNYNVSGFCIADIRRKNETVRGKIIAKATKYDRCAFRC